MLLDLFLLLLCGGGFRQTARADGQREDKVYDASFNTL